MTLEEIEHFARFTGDTFYAHMDEEAAAANPFFPGRVAHGYLLVSWAAGLFVDVVPGERLLDAALAIAASIKQATPRRAGAASKLAIARGEDTDLQSCLSYEAYVQNYLFSTDDHKSRLRALMEQQKRK